MTCQNGEVCFVDLISAGMGISYTLGCSAEEHCKDGSFAPVPPGLIHLWSCCQYNLCNNQNLGPPGPWSEWGPWSPCDVTCGNGTRSRDRHCITGPPGSCSGNSTETEHCQQDPCQEPLDCYSCLIGWDVRGCNTTMTCQHGDVCFVDLISAGMGISYTLGCSAEEHCKDGSFAPVPPGLIHLWSCCHYNLCNNQNLGPPGLWSEWGPWSPCDVTCGNGTRSRDRHCITGPPGSCSGNSTETEHCQQDPCQEPLECYSCLIGWDVRGCNTTMTCQHGDVCFVDLISAGMGISYTLGCSAEEHCKDGSFAPVPPGLIHLWSCCHYNLCNNQNLGPPGLWSEWGPWSQCDVTCGNGTRSRDRHCITGPPGSCSGNSTEIEHCQQDPCQEPLECYSCVVGWVVSGCNTTTTCQSDEASINNGYVFVFKLLLQTFDNVTSFNIRKT
ncbi:SCO-spondin-like [Mercenaria mercenaria]|uniref:SCO-spondin-like n=1 Tax=Mercenaria mercenaria TaxID=6596 RepID=UPI00234F0730|nr:SCO-spondin-like [Mercenaria mercenaria]